MKISENIIEFALDLQQNYLVYNIDELWNKLYKKIRNLVDETVRFELQSKNLGNLLAMRHNCESFFNEYKKFN